MTDRSWTEIQALAISAASGAGVPPAQAMAFGAMLARHLADGGAEAPLARALDASDSIVTLAHRVDSMIETASLSPRVLKACEPDAGWRSLLISWLASLPCEVKVTLEDSTVCARLTLTRPGTRSRPDRIAVSDALMVRMQELAARTYVPDSAQSRSIGAGAGLMDLD